MNLIYFGICQIWVLAIDSNLESIYEIHQCIE